VHGSLWGRDTLKGGILRSLDGLYVLFNPDMGVVASVYPSAPLYKPDRRDYLDVNTPDGMEQDFSFSYEKGMDQYLRDMERYKPYTCDIGPTKYAYDLEEAKALAEKYLLSTGAILTTVEIE
jgi:hypothetical protein